ncbi:MAG: ribokinase [Clostridiales bacterium]|nr:ribokinase [Clostridiales bacterium]
MKKILVMGSFIVDLMGRADHLPAAGETVKGGFFKVGPGGKGSNQAVAAKRMDASITIATKIGRDEFGEIAMKSFQNEKMNTDLVFIDEESPTGAALIMVDGNTSQNKILVTLGACERLTKEDIEKINKKIDTVDIYLTQLETNVDAVEDTITYAASKEKMIVLNPAPVQEISQHIYKYIDIFTPNEIEAGILAGMEVKTFEDAKKAAKIFQSKGVENVIITMGKLGVYLKTKTEEAIIESYQVDVLDTTGAGDAFNGGLVAGLGEGMNLMDATKYANAVAALSVTKLGTAPAMPYKKDVLEFLKTKIM